MCVAVCCCVSQCAAVCCCVLQCVAVCCSVLQCAAVCCSTLQCVAVWCSVLQCVAVCCSEMQCVAMCCSVLHHHAPVSAGARQHDDFIGVKNMIAIPSTQHGCNTLQHTATHCNTLQNIATHCISATHCNTLQHTGLHHFFGCPSLPWGSDPTAKESFERVPGRRANTRRSFLLIYNKDFIFRVQLIDIY